MAIWLKEGRSVEAAKADDARVCDTVERMLNATEVAGMEAVLRNRRSCN